MLPPTYYCAGALDSEQVVSIFIASLRAVSCAAMLAFTGLYMARRGMMTSGLSRGLSQFSMKIAIPCLLFRSIVPGVSYRLLVAAWPMMLLPALYIFTGTLMGLLMLPVLRPPKDFKLGTVSACAFGNTTGIPIIVITVLQQSLSRSVFADFDDPVMYLSLQLLTYPLMHWLHSLLLVKISSLLRPPPQPQEAQQAFLGKSRPHPSNTSFASPTAQFADDMHDDHPAVLSPEKACNFPRSIDSVMSIDEFGSALAYAESVGRTEEEVGVRDRMAVPPSVSERLYAMVKDADLRAKSTTLARRSLKLMRRIFVPSVCGILLGGLVGLLCKPLVLPPEAAPLGWLYMAVSKLGDAAVPINLLLLGAALSRPPRPGVLPRLTTLGLVLARMVLMPLCGLLFVYFIAIKGSKFVIPNVATDPFWLVALVTTCTPTANNIVVLCELTGENRQAMSSTIFYQYCAAPMLLPGVLTLFVASICHIRDDKVMTT